MKWRNLVHNIIYLLDYATSLGGYASPGIKRFLRYNVAASIATLADIFILWFFIEIFYIYYLVSAGIAFAFGSCLNYVINRIWSFKGMKTPFMKGYISFGIIGLVGLMITILLLAFFVETIGIHYLIAKVMVIVIIVFWNYFMNSWITFR